MSVPNPSFTDEDEYRNGEIEREGKMIMGIHNAVHSNFFKKEMKIEFEIGEISNIPRLILGTAEIFYEFVLNENQTAKLRDALANFHTQEEAEAMERAMKKEE